MKIFLRLIILTATIIAAAYLIEGIDVKNTETAAVTALVLGVINTFIRPILKILTFPVNLLSLGLFSFVLNGGILIFVGELIEGLYIVDFMTAIIGAALIGIVSAISNKLLT